MKLTDRVVATLLAILLLCGVAVYSMNYGLHALTGHYLPNGGYPALVELLTTNNEWVEETVELWPLSGPVLTLCYEFFIENKDVDFVGLVQQNYIYMTLWSFLSMSCPVVWLVATLNRSWHQKKEMHANEQNHSRLHRRVG